MDLRAKLAGLLVLGCALSCAQAAHTQARLLLGSTDARPGETVLAGVQLRMDPGWHTYWKNPGGSGMATKIEWHLPPGITPGEIQWPLPEKLPEPELTTFVYSNEVVLLVALQLGTNLAPGPVELKADVSWLECQVSCLPGDAKVSATVNIGQTSRLSTDAPLLRSWGSHLPQDGSGIAARASWVGPANGDLRHSVISWAANGAVTDLDFFPYAGGEEFEVQGAVEKATAEAGRVAIRKPVKKLAGGWPKEISGVLVDTAGGRRVGYEVRLSLGPEAPVAGNLWLMLLYAFLGGLILNVMPCVLPVIALKILGFVGQAREAPARVRNLGLIYALGVWVSFLALAALVIGIKAAGHKAGWGMQFGNPQFLVILTALVTLVALNLFGVFEVNPGGRVMNTAGSLASRHGAAGAFFNGVLATVLATPCTAPFLGAALGFAFAQSAPVILAIFSTVAAGLAFPYVVLSWKPGWLKFLPRPGPWMERFKVALGFPMLATAVWLLSLIPIHYGQRSWWLGVFLVALACAAWVFGTFVQRNPRWRVQGWTITLGLLVAAYQFLLEGQLHWRQPQPGGVAATSGQGGESGGLAWQPWSAASVAQARAAGHPVLVDFTAKWCLTCNTIVKPVLESAGVRKKVAETGAVPLLGDYTRFPDDITAELNRYQRAGVPLVLVFPKNPAEPAIVLPEAPTPGQVIEALSRAASL